MKFIDLFIVFNILFLTAFGQTNVNHAPEKNNNNKIIVETMDGIKCTGLLIDCSDYILEIQLWNITDSALLSPFYFKVSDNVYRVLIEHVNTVAISKGKRIGFTTAAGAFSGGIVLGSAGYQIANSNEENDYNFRAISAMGVGFAAGIVIGAPIGFFAGLFTRKKISINGNGTNTSKLKKYF